MSKSINKHKIQNSPFAFHLFLFLTLSVAGMEIGLWSNSRLKWACEWGYPIIVHEMHVILSWSLFSIHFSRNFVEISQWMKTVYRNWTVAMGNPNCWYLRIWMNDLLKWFSLPSVSCSSNWETASFVSIRCQRQQRISNFQSWRWTVRNGSHEICNYLSICSTMLPMRPVRSSV